MSTVEQVIWDNLNPCSQAVATHTGLRICSVWNEYRAVDQHCWLLLGPGCVETVGTWACVWLGQRQPRAFIVVTYLCLKPRVFLSCSQQFPKYLALGPGLALGTLMSLRGVPGRVFLLLVSLPPLLKHQIPALS